MKDIIELSEGTVKTLKEMDEALKTHVKNFQDKVTEYNNIVTGFQTQKQIILSTVLQEKNLDTSKKYKLNEDYTIELISDEDYALLLEDSKNKALEVEAS